MELLPSPLEDAQHTDSCILDAPQGELKVDFHAHSHSLFIEPVYYTPHEVEFPETASFQVIGEVDPIEYSGSEDEDTVPVRVITDFTIYEEGTQRLVPVAELLRVNHDDTQQLVASGCIKAWIDDDEWEDVTLEDDAQDDEDLPISSLCEERSQRVKLTRIKKFTLHDMKRGQKLDSHSISYEDFVKYLKVTPTSSEEVSMAVKMLGRSINEEDLQADDVKSYLLATLCELHEQEHIDIRRTPVMRTLFGQQVSYEDQQGIKRHSKPKSASRARLSPCCTSTSNVEMQVLEHRNTTVVTAAVGRITQLLFEKNIKIASKVMVRDAEVDESALLNMARSSVVHHLANPMVKWLQPAEHPNCYISVMVDGIVYSVGDTVMVEPGIDENVARAKSYRHDPSQSSNSLANRYWFCRIRYLFQDKGRKKFHGQWLTHSSKTLLQELGHANALYLMLSDCEDIDIEAISQKCNVRELNEDALEPEETADTEENDFFSGLMFNSADASLISLSAEQTKCALAHCNDHQQCLSCGIKAMQEAVTHPRPLPGGGFTQYNFSYHPHDFVYIKCKQPHSVYKIGQILKVKSMKNPIEVMVQLFGRYDDVVRSIQKKHNKKPLHFDDRRLFKTNKIEMVYHEHLRGICYVIHEYNTAAIDEWVKYNDHYYVNQEAPLLEVDSLDSLKDWPGDRYQCCIKCHQEHKGLLDHQNRLLARQGRLRGMELFSGAGGLGTGFSLSGFVETRWAIEFSPSAAQTYQQNHPETIVYNQCTNLCLQHAIDTHHGKNPKPLCSLDHNKVLPPMPKQGEVDFIYGGPPCQSFSLMNHSKANDDIRSTLICNMLSYVEFYQPMYLLLENVYGILVHQVNARTQTVQLGIVKFIQRALAAIGYQSQFKILQAAQYGAPQGRRRVIFWGARRDMLLPEWPLPTHCSPAKLYAVQLPGGITLAPTVRFKNDEDSKDNDCSAPLHFVTIYEAIGDLPPFDWYMKNPHETIKETIEDKQEACRRQVELKIPVFSGVNPKEPPYFSGYTRPRKHYSEPLSRYQRWMRRHQDGGINMDLLYHYTRRFTPAIVERTCTIPLRAGANQFDLPKKLHMNLTKRKGAHAIYKSLYKRLDGNGVFATALTTVAPNSKGGSVLHPTQRRIITVQECARAQGFPDHYEFLSVNKENQIIKDVCPHLRW
ncbi:S-adenosyl-L-methionine-dependent methyltransferase [Phlebopus sp. FC_14]|nr:S-adenosyl-L-methionine-dependent methyltransferase [Phlebopus sp. FC_14]